MGRLGGKVAAVTGGANGLGASIVELYAREGATVVFGDVLVQDGAHLAAKLVANGLDAEFVRTDVTRRTMFGRLSLALRISTAGSTS
jgi:NAD(P)-dependent dehydrogenase (short-subunit alcohol dehydrogenase family)